MQGDVQSGGVQGGVQSGVQRYAGQVLLEKTFPVHVHSAVVALSWIQLWDRELILKRFSARK